jgi:MFS family permease
MRRNHEEPFGRGQRSLTIEERMIHYAWIIAFTGTLVLLLTQGFGISMSAIPAIMAAAGGDSMGGKLAPAALGFITLIFGIGQSFGPAVAGWIKDTTGTFAGAFILSAGISLLGAAGSMILRKKA